jgi:hypothetical protein
MRVSTMVRSGALLLTLAALAACSDAPSAPSASEALRFARPDSMTVPTLQKHAKTVKLKTLDWNKVSFTIDPSQAQNVVFGEHTLSFPANSICDPDRSSYGEAFWDAPCKPLRKPITITAEWTIGDSHVEVEFEPAIRFVPAGAKDVDRWVVLSLSERAAREGKNKWNILWRDPAGGWVDESRKDPTMQTFVTRGGRRVARRIKHFSGYNVTAGFMDDSGLGGIDVGIRLW